MPFFDETNLGYLAVLPMSKRAYAGATQKQLMERKRLHVSQTTSKARMTMDRCHAYMLKDGVYKYLFGPLVGLREGNVTRLRLEEVEGRLFVLYRVNMNTLHQGARGICTYHLVS